MKIMKILIIFWMLIALPQVSFAVSKPEPVESPSLVKLGGTWFLRTKDKCTEIKLNRKGRSERVLMQRDVYIDRREDYLYLTSKGFFHTYTYRMLPLVWGASYALEPLVVAPHEPPRGIDQIPEEIRYTGIFRVMTDCQLGPFHQYQSGVQASSY